MAVRILPPWFENVGKRLVKSPKVYIRDSGILHQLLGLKTLADVQSHPKMGASWEGFAIEHIVNRWGGRDAYFWATQSRAELDLIILKNGKKWGFEFKAAGTPKRTRSMTVSMEDLQLEKLFVIHPGTISWSMDDRLEAVPLILIDQKLKDLNWS